MSVNYIDYSQPTEYFKDLRLVLGSEVDHILTPDKPWEEKVLWMGSSSIFNKVTKGHLVWFWKKNPLDFDTDETIKGLGTRKGHKTTFKFFACENLFKNDFILLPAFYLIMWLIKSSKNFEKIAILKIFNVQSMVKIYNLIF